MFNFCIQIHKNLFLWMNGLLDQYPQCEDIIYFVAEKFDGYVVLLSLVVLSYLIYKSIEDTLWNRFVFLLKEGVRIITAVAVSWGLSYLIKGLTHLPRPFLRFPDEVTLLFNYGGFDSFPSGHATLFMALGVMIFLHQRRAGTIFIFFAIIISLARIIAGIHFPIDIIFGWIIGGGLSFMIYKNLKL